MLTETTIYNNIYRALSSLEDSPEAKLLMISFLETIKDRREKLFNDQSRGKGWIKHKRLHRENALRT